MRWGPLVTMGALVFAIAGLFLVLSRVNLSAIQQPGRTEEYLRSKITRAVIRRRAAREEIPVGPADRETSMSLAAGKNVYDADCASCHGPDGRTPTATGRGMLPPAVALDSDRVQSYSDRFADSRASTFQPALGRRSFRTKAYANSVLSVA